MFDSDLMGKIVTGLITAVSAVVVCLINNYVTLKKDRESRDQKFISDLNEIRKSNEKAIAEIKADFMAHMEELLASQTDLLNQINIVKLNYENLCKAVEKHNNVVERTYKLENRLDVAEEKQRVANNRIDDLEDETKALRGK